MHYIVVNTGNDDVENFSLGYAADIMIGNDDSALVTTGQNEQGSNTYIQMQEKNTGKMFRLYVKGTSYGITDVDRFWIGLWQGGGYRKHAFDDMHDPTTGGDSAFSCSWVDRTIPANSSTIYSVKLGVGELSEMGGTSNTVTLDAVTAVKSATIQAILFRLRALKLQHALDINLTAGILRVMEVQSRRVILRKVLPCMPIGKRLYMDWKTTLLYRQI